MTTADVTGATTVYWTPYKGNQVQLWNGTAWTAYASDEISIALGTVTAALCYDVFMYQNAGTPTLEKLAWTSATARATAVTLQDGRYCKSGDKTRLYLGTFYTTSTTTTEDSAGGTTTSVGGKRFLWNYYNRALRNLKVKDTTDNWTYATATIRQARAQAGNKVELVIGIAEDIVEANVITTVSLVSNTAAGQKTGVGVDSTTVFSGFQCGAYEASGSNSHGTPSGQYKDFLTVGYHYLAWLERGGGSGTVTWLGSNDSTQTGMFAQVFA